MLRTFDSSTGQLILEKRLHKPHEGPHLYPGDFGNGTEIASVDQSQDIVVLTNGHNVQRVGETGSVRWIWESADKR
jgi:ER membrane protein complex subunit 1